MLLCFPSLQVNRLRAMFINIMFGGFPDCGVGLHC